MNILLQPERDAAAKSNLSRIRSQVLATLRRAACFRVPVGYQDEQGFHYGVEPEQSAARFPPFW